MSARLGRCLIAAPALSLVMLVRAGGVGPAQPDAPPVATFVGARACASCHQEMHDTWSGGRHSRMLQPATAASVLGDFARASTLLHGNRFQLRAADGAFFISESYLTGQTREHRIEYTLGSRRVQHYVTTVEKGRMVLLPPSWDVQRRQWFDNMDIVRPGRDAGTPVQQWNKDCVGCHVSGEEKRFNPETQEYRTDWTDFGTSCERCHGPGSRHVDAYAREPKTRPAGQRLIVKPTRLDPQTSSMICAQCHSLRNVISPGFQAGDDYFDFFTPRLEYDPGTDRELPYWPDGRPRRFSNDAIGLWQSACYRQGGATCTTCHRDPHRPDVDRNPQLAPSNNALCTQCHQAIGERTAAHTRHTIGSSGSSCIACHMPKTVVSINATMRDHTMSVPAPENTAAFGIPNACNECHADKNAAWAAGVLNTWWPGGRRRKLIERAQVFSAARRRAPEAVAGLIALAQDAGNGPLIQATAVGYLRRYPGAPARAALLAAAAAADPAIRAAAMASLGERDSSADDTSRSALFAALSDRRRAVRIAALVSLINTRGAAPAAADAGRLQAVGREYAALTALYQDDPGFDRDLGIIQLLGGDVTRAAETLEISLRLDPTQPSAAFVLALARLGQGRIAEARALLQRVTPSDPSYQAARRRLDLLAK